MFHPDEFQFKILKTQQAVSSWWVPVWKHNRLFCPDEFQFKQWRSKGGASGGMRPGAQALRAHQHTFCKHLKTRF